MLTGERPDLHSSFIAALSQTLLSIWKPRPLCVAASDADASSNVCLCVPCVMMTVIPFQYDHTSEGGVKCFIWWDNNIDLERFNTLSCKLTYSTAFNLRKFTTGSITGENVNLINNKILCTHTLKKMNLFQFSLFLSCLYICVSLQRTEENLNVGEFRKAKLRNMSVERWFM